MSQSLVNAGNNGYLSIQPKTTISAPSDGGSSSNVNITFSGADSSTSGSFNNSQITQAGVFWSGDVLKVKPSMGSFFFRTDNQYSKRPNEDVSVVILCEY